jgi:hypothetical protein
MGFFSLNVDDRLNIDILLSLLWFIWDINWEITKLLIIVCVAN